MQLIFLRIILLQASGVQTELSTIDWVVIATYVLIMLSVGWFYQDKNKTTDDYLLGGRKLNSTAVGISLFATLMSTLSYLTYPGELIKHGPVIFMGMLGFPLIYYVAGWWLIPRIMSVKVTSAYEILERKIGVSVRMLATFMFLLFRILWMATIIYVTVDVALRSVIPFDPMYIPFISMGITAITIVYTSMGGLKAVVVTDVLQTVIFLGGALLSIVIAGTQLESFSALIPAEWPAHWDTFRWGFDPQERTTTGNAILVLFTWYICTTGADQMAIQRYLSIKDVESARRSFRISLFSNGIAFVLLAFVGLAVLAWFTQNGQLLVPGKSLRDQADTLFPRFILMALPPGVSGLVISGLLAAAMSSLSSGLNSVSSVISEDLLKRFRKRAPAFDPLTEVKLLSFFTGGIVIALSFLINQVQGNLLDVIMKVVNPLMAPLFVLFFMAFFVPFATERATFAGGIFAIVVAVAIAFYQVFGIMVMWIMPVSLVAGILVAVLLSILDRLLLKQGLYKV